MSAELFNSLLKESLQEVNYKVSKSSSIDNNDEDMDDDMDDDMDEDMDEDIDDDENNVCLITGESLNDKHITLSCNHSFNYVPLMREVTQWKNNYKNKSYCYYNKINFNTQTICPYCRTVTDGILPWFEKVNDVDVSKIRWVNWPKKHWYLKNKCLYQFASGKKKGECCGKGCFELFCSQHEKHKDKYDEHGVLKVKTADKKKTRNKKKSSQGKFSCMHILSRGKRKGMCCGKNAKARTQSETNFILYHCSSHYKYYL